MRKKKGFTLIELLVVIAIIAMLLAILMPALGKVKKLAMRLVCGTNCKGLGTAMNVYAFDYDDEFPVQGQGGPRTWKETTNDYFNATGINWDATSGLTIESSLYMLVREADVSPKSFVCPATSDQEFKISEDYIIGSKSLTAELELTDIWDFGNYPCGGWDGQGDGSGHDTTSHCSYSYQQVYDEVNTSNERMNRPDASGNAANVVLADRSPWCDTNLEFIAPTGTAPNDWTSFVSKINNYEDSSSDETVKMANSANHDREGQNVLYNDGHAEFAKRSDVSQNNDNIYTRYSSTGGTDEAFWRIGMKMSPIDSEGYALSSKDTVLVSSQRCK